MKLLFLPINSIIGLCLVSSCSLASTMFGGYLSGKGSVGQFGSSSAALTDRFVGVGGVDSLLGFNFRGVTYGVHFQYDLVGQITPLSDVANTNSKGNIASLGLGIRYFWNDDYHLTGILDFSGDYVFSEKTIGSENDKMNKPITLRVAVGKRLDLSYLVTVDGVFNYSNYSNFHIGGRDYEWTSKLWSLGVGLTWHFGKALKYIPESDALPVASATSSVKPTQEVGVDASNTAQSSQSKADIRKEDTRERIRSHYIFTANHYRVGAKMVAELKKVAVRIKANPNMRVEVEGHSDTSGLEKMNTSLSKARAESVRRYLIKLGVEPERIVAIEKSDLNPVSSNETKEGRARNRRYEIILISQGGAQ